MGQLEWKKNNEWTEFGIKETAAETDTGTTPSKSLSIYKLFKQKVSLTRAKLNKRKTRNTKKTRNKTFFPQVFFFRLFSFFLQMKTNTFCTIKYAKDNKLKLTHKQSTTNFFDKSFRIWLLHKPRRKLFCSFYPLCLQLLAKNGEFNSHEKRR